MRPLLLCQCCDMHVATTWWADVLLCDRCLMLCDTTERICVVRAAEHASKRDAPLLYVPREEDDSQARP